EAVEHLGQFSVGRTASTGSVFGQRQHKDNVLVNSVAPGPIETPLVEGISQEWKAAKARELPLGRFGKVEEVAPIAVLLASEPGGNLFVGQTLNPNAGDVMP
ncbi:SDR family oxidoreductase, partial [Pseudomonas putida]|uniref:SDR family oxidoreductase n=1 Tax=Pseudomonas putida TaxID=303 RepID=UPI00346630BB